MIRKAKISDVKEIQQLINSAKGNSSRRSLVDLYDHLRDFLVFIRGKRLVVSLRLTSAGKGWPRSDRLVVEKESAQQRDRFSNW